MKRAYFSIIVLCAINLSAQVPLSCDGMLQIMNAVHSGYIKGASKYGTTYTAADKYRILQSTLNLTGQSDAFVFESYFLATPSLSAHFTMFNGSKKDAKAKWEELVSLLKSCTWPGWTEDTKNSKKDFYMISTGQQGKSGYKIVAVSLSSEKSKPGKNWEADLFVEETFASIPGY